MNDRAFSHVKGWNWIMRNWNAHFFSVTAKAVRCYYDLEKVVIFPHKIILSTAIMELSEFFNDSLLLIICHRVSRCSKSLWYMYHSCCQPKRKSGESQGHRYTYCSFWQLNFISTSMLLHTGKKNSHRCKWCNGSHWCQSQWLESSGRPKNAFPVLETWAFSIYCKCISAFF